MGNLNIRNVPDETVRQIKITAAENGRSMEAELRDLVSRSYAPRPSEPNTRVQKWVRELYEGSPPSGVVDDFIRHRHEDFDD